MQLPDRLKGLLVGARWITYVSLNRRFGAGHPVAQDQWDHEYSAGDWDRLSQAGEKARYIAIANFLGRCRPGARILDAGCGEGVLLDYLSRDAYSEYLGLDLSERAIQLSVKRRNNRTQFATRNIERFLPEPVYDAIVVNESLYYVGRPLKVMAQLARGLVDGGVLVVSMQEPSGKYIWPALTHRYKLVDSSRVASTDGLTWQIGVFSCL